MIFVILEGETDQQKNDLSNIGDEKMHQELRTNLAFEDQVTLQ